MKIENIEELENLVSRYDISHVHMEPQEQRKLAQDRVLYYLKTGQPIEEIIAYLKQRTIKNLRAKIGKMSPQSPNAMVARYEEKIMEEIKSLSDNPSPLSQ